MYLAGRSMVPTHNSTLAMDFARSAAVKTHLPTVIFSLRDVQAGHHDCGCSLRSGEVERHPRRSDERRDWRKIALKSAELAEAPLFYRRLPNLTMSRSRQISSPQAAARPAADVIDYMQLMTSGKRVESRQQECRSSRAP